MLAYEAKTGGKASRLYSKPTLRTDCTKYRQGYLALTNARNYNEAGLQPIQISEVLAYIEIAGIERGYPAQKFLRMMQGMDSEHLEWWSKKQSKSQPKK